VLDEEIGRSPMIPAPIKSTVSRSSLDAIDARVGTILKVEDVSASSKLMRVVVSFGDHTRTILAGLKKERMKALELQGRQALFVVNLEPRRMAGEVSEACFSISVMRMASSPS
jgi:tRNA-binding protein